MQQHDFKIKLSQSQESSPKREFAKMHHLRLRFIYVFEFLLALTALVLALTTLLVGINGNHPKSPAIAEFNTSSVGLPDFYNTSSKLHNNITALVPPSVANPPSITQYLGIHDWYSIHYLSNCSGFFAPSTSNPAVLSSNKVNITCKRQISGYSYNPHEVVKSQIRQEVKGLADNLDNDTYKTGVWISLWYSGIGNCVLVVFLLPWNFKRQREWVRSGVFWQSFVSTVMFLVTSAHFTACAIHVHKSTGLPGPNEYAGGFLALTWTSMICIAIVCSLNILEWKFGRQIDEGCYKRWGNKRTTGNVAPIEKWRSEKTIAGDEK